MTAVSGVQPAANGPVAAQRPDPTSGSVGDGRGPERWTAETAAALYREIGNFLIQEGALSRLDDFAEHILEALADAGLLVTPGGGPEGICGDESPHHGLNCTGTMRAICHLAFGHRSRWHESELGQRWKYGKREVDHA